MNSTEDSGAESLVVHARGPRPDARLLAQELADVATALPLFAMAPLLRRWHRHWGATPAEIGEPMPGDDVVPGCQYTINRAITIAAPPSAVWPWIAQIGFGKAGFYSYDLLDNAGRESAREIIGSLQDPAPGDWVPMFTKVNKTTAFRIALVEPPVHILWVKPDSTWAWRLRAKGRGTRLVTRLRIQYPWQRPAEAVFSLFLNEFGDFPMMRRMLLNLKMRAESSQIVPAISRGVPTTLYTPA